MSSDRYRPCVAIYPGGETRKASVLHINLMTVDKALSALGEGHAAYVAPEDADMVITLKVKGNATSGAVSM